MCDVCADLVPSWGAVDADRLWPLARRIEASMPGRRATEREWGIFRGTATGAIPFAVLQRLGACRIEALRKLEERTAPLARWRCEAIDGDLCETEEKTGP